MPSAAAVSERRSSSLGRTWPSTAVRFQPPGQPQPGPPGKQTGLEMVAEASPQRCCCRPSRSTPRPANPVPPPSASWPSWAASGGRINKITCLPGPSAETNARLDHLARRPPRPAYASTRRPPGHTRAGTQINTGAPDAAGPAMKPCGLKNALEAGRQTPHTAAAPASQAAMNSAVTS